MTAARIRWSDHDRYFGPFTYAHEPSRRGSFALVLGSGDDGDYPGCRLRLTALSHTLILRLPPIIRPWRRKVQALGWDAATVARLGRDWYWDCHEREYGVSYFEGFLNVFLGRQTHDSSTEQRWAYFLPWTQWRHVRHAIYDREGKHFATEPKYRIGTPGWEAWRETEAACPTWRFAFRDFDGEELAVITRIEEREWLFGEGWFKWLSLFRRPMVVRSLSLEFSGETGRRKGSWKGGTIGAGITMLPGEMHEAAFRRYCAEHAMTFVGTILK